MIVFTLTNTITDDVWVGTTREDVPPAERFEQFQDALILELDHPFYKDLKVFGADSFKLDEYAAAESREELKELFEEAMEAYSGKSLASIKVVKPGTTREALTQPIKRKPATKSIKSAPAKPTSTARKTVSLDKPKLASGRTGSAKKEKAIKEGIALQKAEMEAKKAKKAMEEAAEMKRIMAALDSRGSTLKKR